MTNSTNKFTSKERYHKKRLNEVGKIRPMNYTLYTKDWFKKRNINCYFENGEWHVTKDGREVRVAPSKTNYGTIRRFVTWWDGETHKAKGITLSTLIIVLVKGEDMPSIYHVVDHIDDNAMNDVPENLQWITRRENTAKMWRDKKTKGIKPDCRKNKGERLNKYIYWNSDLGKTMWKPELQPLYDKWHQLLDERKRLINLKVQAKNTDNYELWHKIIKDILNLSSQINQIKLEIENKKKDIK